MSILYKGLNPKHHYGLCILTINGELITANGKHFQAIQIPTPHGRLIDGGKLNKSVHEWNPAYTYGRSAFTREIESAPTILESEGNDEFNT